MLCKITFSPTGGTDRVTDMLIDSIKEYREEDQININLLVRDPSHRQADLGPEDLAVIAVPSFGGRVPAIASSRLRRIHGNGARAILVVVYGNRTYNDTLLELKEVAQSAGFRPVAAVTAIAEHSIVHEIAHGRPDEGDRKVLAQMAGQIADKLSRKEDTCPDVPGSYPYKLFHGLPLRTWAKDFCIFCTSCALECPVGAIPEETPNLPSNGSCISCMRCVAVCPVQARTPDEGTAEAIRQKITPLCVDRKECELFL